MQPNLLTTEAWAALPAIYATERDGDAAVVHIRLFAPGTYWEWYVIEAAAVVETPAGVEELPLPAAAARGLRAIGDSDADGLLIDVLLFGVVSGHDVDMGYFSLAELLDQAGSSIAVERDATWRPRPLGEVREQIAARRRG